MFFIGRHQDGLTLFDNLLSPSIVEGFRGQKTDAGMVVFLVVPAKESLTKRSRIFNTPESFRELGPVLEGLELNLRIGVVIAYFWSGVAFGNSQIG